MSQSFGRNVMGELPIFAHVPLPELEVEAAVTCMGRRDLRRPSLSDSMKAVSMTVGRSQLCMLCRCLVAAVCLGLRWWSDAVLARENPLLDSAYFALVLSAVQKLDLAALGGAVFCCFYVLEESTQE